MFESYDYYDDSAYENMYDDQVEKEMRQLKCNALEKLRLTVHPKIVDSFASILGSTNLEYEDDFHVKTIALACHLDKLDLLSLSEDFEAFKQEYEKQETYRKESSYEF